MTLTYDSNGVYVAGIATDGEPDGDDQIIDPAFAERGLRDWLRDGGVLHQMHSDALVPVSRVVKMEVRPEGIWLRAHVVEPVAVRLVKSGTYQAFSLQVQDLRLVRDPRARGGRIIGGTISDVSLIDYPANPRSKFQLTKSFAPGTRRPVTVEKAEAGTSAYAEQIGAVPRGTARAEAERLAQQAARGDSTAARLAFDCLIRLVGGEAAAQLVIDAPARRM